LQIRLTRRPFANVAALHETGDVIPLTEPVVSTLRPLTHHLHAKLKAVLVVRLDRVCKTVLQNL
jgi:hypothetical protein